MPTARIVSDHSQITTKTARTTRSRIRSPGFVATQPLTDLHGPHGGHGAHGHNKKMLVCPCSGPCVPCVQCKSVEEPVWRFHAAIIAFRATRCDPRTEFRSK